MRVVLLGARGGLGRLVHRALTRNGHQVIGVGRRDGDVVGDPRDPAVVARAAAGAGAIVNCAGASVALGLGHGWRGYRAVDTPIGLASITAARRTGARLVYVGVHHPPALARCAYVEAHERVVRAAEGLDAVIIRATGFYSAYLALLPLARRGVLVDIGDGHARTNPIDEHDLAAIAAESVAGKGPRELAAGGPEILTRREIFERIATLAGRPVTIRGVPVWLARASAAALALAHPRIGQFARFAALLAQHDVIAPALGTTSFARYLERERLSVATRRPAGLIRSGDAGWS